MKNGNHEQFFALDGAVKASYKVGILGGLLSCFLWLGSQTNIIRKAFSQDAREIALEPLSRWHRPWLSWWKETQRLSDLMEGLPQRRVREAYCPLHLSCGPPPPSSSGTQGISYSDPSVYCFNFSLNAGSIRRGQAGRSCRVLQSIVRTITFTLREIRSVWGFFL